MNNFVLKLVARNTYEKDGNFKNLLPPVKRGLKALADEYDKSLYDVYSAVLGYSSKEEERSAFDSLTREKTNHLQSREVFMLTSIIAVAITEFNPGLRAKILKDFEELELPLASFYTNEYLKDILGNQGVNIIKGQISAEFNKDLDIYIPENLWEDKYKLLILAFYKLKYPESNMSLKLLIHLEATGSKNLSILIDQGVLSQKLLVEMSNISGYTMKSLYLKNGYNFVNYSEYIKRGSKIVLDCGELVSVIVENASAPSSIITLNKSDFIELERRNFFEGIVFKSIRRASTKKKDILKGKLEIKVIDNVAHILGRPIMEGLNNKKVLYLDSDLPNNVRKINTDLSEKELNTLIIGGTK